MGKIVRTVLKIAAIAVQFIPGIGQLASLAITIGLSLLSTALAPKNPKVSPAQRDRLFATIDPSAPRKIVFGSTAMATDIRYEEWGGTDQEYLDRIIAVASHKVQAIREIWIEDKLAWSSAGGVTSTYAGYLTVQTRLEGTSANTIAINGGGKWGSSRRLTGCAYVHMRFKTTGNSKKASSPFASSIPQRLTIIGDGALLYDPRQDSTVGGSGTQRANDQSTWAWTSDNVGNNVALQELFYLLGWKINGKLAVGRGIPPSRIDMASFIAAANMCEENVTLAVGGTEKRYRGAGVVSEADAPSAVLEAMHASCAGTLRDASGKLALSILYNDLASPVTAFTDDDVIGQFQWQATRSLDDSFNIVRGRRTDPSTSALYQLVDYPPVTLTSPDGLERTHTFDLSMVQSASQAQRLAKQELQRAQYQGVFSAKFKATGLRATVGQVVTLTFSPLAFAAKLFRITEQTINMDGTVDLTLREENAAIYAWATEETAAVVAAAPITYDPLNSPLIQGIEAAPSIVAYPAGLPVDPAIGSLYVDSTRKQFIYIGAQITSDEGDVSSDEGLITSDGYEDIQDQAIQTTRDLALQANTDAELAVNRLANIDDDGTIDISEKTSTLIPENSRLEGSYTTLVASAAIAGVSTTAAASARSAWLALRNAIVPAWDDITADSPVVRNSYDAALNAYRDALAALTTAVIEAMTAAKQVVIVPPVAQIVYRDWQGNIKSGQYPRTLTPKVERGGVDIRDDDDVTYSITTTGTIAATVNNTTGSADKGKITPTDGSSGSIVLTVAVAGVTFPTFTIPFTNQDDNPPTTGGGGGGNTGGSDSTLEDVSSTTFATITQQDGGESVFLIDITSGQTLYGTAPLTYQKSGTNTTPTSMTARWEYRLQGNPTWLPFVAGPTNVTGSGAYFNDTDFIAEPGDIACNQNKTGLATGTYEVQLIAAKSNSAAGTLQILSGAATVSKS